MTQFLKNFITDDYGASAAEYALILVIVGLGIVTAGLALKNAIGNAMMNTASCIETAAGPNSTCS